MGVSAAAGFLGGRFGVWGHTSSEALGLNLFLLFRLFCCVRPVGWFHYNSNLNWVRFVIQPTGSAPVVQLNLRLQIVAEFEDPVDKLWLFGGRQLIVVPREAVHP
jgi:hypothetical protein